MAVPTSIRDVAAPMSVAAVMTSNSSGICGVQTESKPGLVGPAGVRLQLLHLGGVPTPVGAHLKTDPHSGLLSVSEMTFSSTVHVAIASC